MRRLVKPDQLAVDDVIEIAPGASLRTITAITEATHPLAAERGALVIYTVLWDDGRPMPPITRFPHGDVVVVGNRKEFTQ